MLFCLFSDEKLHALFDQMGYSLDPDVVQRTVKYYEARTTRGAFAVYEIPCSAFGEHLGFDVSGDAATVEVGPVLFGELAIEGAVAVADRGE